MTIFFLHESILVLNTESLLTALLKTVALKCLETGKNQSEPYQDNKVVCSRYNPWLHKSGIFQKITYSMQNYSIGS